MIIQCVYNLVGSRIRFGVYNYLRLAWKQALARCDRELLLCEIYHVHRAWHRRSESFPVHKHLFSL
jgi:hypothetical protein